MRIIKKYRFHFLILLTIVFVFFSVGSGYANPILDTFSHVTRHWNGLKRLINVTGVKETGKNVVIGVIDSGIHPHPDLKDKLCKARSKNFTTDSVYSGHGTHVAGIISRIAPDATLVDYKVFGKRTKVDDDQIISAVNQAMQDDVDILNMSLGGMELNRRVLETIQRAYSKGIMVVGAVGNEGLEGYESVVFPGGLPNVIGVGACTPFTHLPVLELLKLKKTLLLNPVKGLLPVSDTYSVEDFTSRVILKGLKDSKPTKIDRDQVDAVLSLAGKDLLYTPNDYFEEPPFCAYVFEKDAPFIEEELSHEKGLIRFNLEQKERSIMSAISSRGPVFRVIMKPDIVAPGIGILSTCKEDGYMYASGTSMAVPIVTGAAALIKEAHSEWSLEDVRSSLCNRATPLKGYRDKPYDVNIQGAGLLNVKESLQQEMTTNPNAITFVASMKDARGKMIEKEITLNNKGNCKKTYALSLEEETLPGIHVDFPPSVTVASGKEEKVKITVQINCSKRDYLSKSPSGRIVFTCGDEKIRVPYMVTVIS